MAENYASTNYILYMALQCYGCIHLRDILILYFYGFCDKSPMLSAILEKVVKDTKLVVSLKVFIYCYNLSYRLFYQYLS